MLISGCETDPAVRNNNPQNIQTTKYHDWNPMGYALDVDLYDVYFISKSHGWIVGDDKTLISTSIGEDGWTLAPVYFPANNFRSIFFIDEQKGWMAGDLDGSPLMGQIHYSGQGGAYPIQQESFESPLNVVKFKNSQTGWAAGDEGLIIYTGNGGKNWEIMDKFTSSNIMDLDFQDDMNYWVVTSQGGLYHTDDGISWKKIDLGIDSDLNAIQFTDSDHGWICGGNNTVLIGLKNSGGDMTWEVMDFEGELASTSWNDIYFINNEEGWVIGNGGRVYMTADGGATWVAQISNVFSNLNAVFMLDNKTGWIVGKEGQILSYNPE